MPESEIGVELRAILTRHASLLDTQTRETLRFPVITVAKRRGYRQGTEI
jgi:hypothetical protein